MGAIEIVRREAVYVRHMVVQFVYGREVNAPYTRHYLRVRWHLQREGKCISPGCGDPGQASCGFSYRREARAALARIQA